MPAQGRAKGQSPVAPPWGEGINSQKALKGRDRIEGQLRASIQRLDGDYAWHQVIPGRRCALPWAGMFRPCRPLRHENGLSISSTDGPGLDELLARLGRKTDTFIIDKSFTISGGRCPGPKSHDFGYEYPRKKAHRTLSVGFRAHSLLAVSCDLHRGRDDSLA